MPGAQAAKMQPAALWPGYLPRQPQETVLYQVVQRWLQPFIEQTQATGSLPRFVLRELEDFVRCGRLELGTRDEDSDERACTKRRPSRTSWSRLLARVFRIDVTVCPDPACGGRMKIVRFVTDHAQIQSQLKGMPRAPPLPRPGAQPMTLGLFQRQLELPFL